MKTETNKTKDEAASPVDALVSGTASELAEQKLFEYLESEGLDIGDLEWSGCPRWIEQAMKEYARQKCKEQRQICSDVAAVDLPSHPHLNGTGNVNNIVIENAPEPEYH